MRNLVRTLEIIYWSIAFLVGILIFSLSPIIAYQWINADKLSPETIKQALLIMGFVMFFQMPTGFYSGGLMGLQKQVLLNIINIFMNTLRGVGAVLVLWLVSPTIQAFLLWQTGVSLINAFLLALCLWRSLPQSENKAVFQRELINGIWRFSAGMSGITILAIILTQLDKLILSKMLSLEMFGYYTLASMMAMSLRCIITPIFFSIYPRFTQLVSADDQESLKELYHKICQLVSVLVFPVSILMALFSYEIILLWTQDEMTAKNAHLILSLLICGSALNGIMHPPYALQLAFGWTKLSFVKNIIAVLVLVPFIIVVTTRYGATGAASAWLLLNIGYVLLEIPIMHRRLLRKEKWHWYWQDVTIPLIAGLSVAVLGRFFLDDITSTLIIFLYLIVISVLTLTVTITSVPAIRSRIYGNLMRL